MRVQNESMVSAFYVGTVRRRPVQPVSGNCSLVFLVLGLFLPGLFGVLFYTIGFAMLIYSYIRMFSRNHAQRIAENRWYWEKRNAVMSWFGGVKTRFSLRKTYHYYRCPRCHQQLRVPRGRSRISITCPKCGTSFIKKS